MGNRSYRKGYEFERRVRKLLEERGYVVFRSAGSKPVDLIVTDGRETYVIECKVNRGDLRREDLERMLKIHRRTRYIPVLAYRGRRGVRFVNLLTGEDMEFPDLASLDRFMDAGSA